VTVLNAVMGRTLDIFLAPFRSLPAIVGLSVVSLVTAVVVMLVFRATSNQQKLADVKRRIAAALFEIRLFNDDLPAVFRAQGELLRHNATYLRLSLVPMLWMIVPIALLVAHLEFRYGYTGLTPGEPAIVKVQLRNGVKLAPSKPAADTTSAANMTTGEIASSDAASGNTASGNTAMLEAPAEIKVLTSPVWFPTSNEVVWRIRPEAAGEYELRAHIGAEAFSKHVEVGDAVVRRSPIRVGRGLVAQFMNPAEPPLPDGAAVASISVPYERRAVRVFGWELDWLLVFFALSTVFAFALKKPLRVTV
jgi:hypothetical protein